MIELLLTAVVAQQVVRLLCLTVSNFEVYTICWLYGLDLWPFNCISSRHVASREGSNISFRFRDCMIIRSWIKVRFMYELCEAWWLEVWFIDVKMYICHGETTAFRSNYLSFCSSVKGRQGTDGQTEIQRRLFLNARALGYNWAGITT